MQKVRLRIDTDIDGAVRLFRSDAMLEEEAGTVTVRYQLEGDAGILHFEQNEMQMERIGEVNINARFSSFEKSRMSTTLAQSYGEIPIRTQSYAFKRFSKYILVELIYFILFENSQSAIKIKILISA